MVSYFIFLRQNSLLKVSDVLPWRLVQRPGMLTVAHELSGWSDLPGHVQHTL